MSQLVTGARQLPLRHISIRVPWNDTNWCGVVCKNPVENSSCMILKNIRASRKDAEEETIAGQTWQGLSQATMPPCVGEHGNFMAPYELTRELKHPYAANSRAHAHLRATTLRYPPYSAAAVPFNWMLRENAAEKVQVLDLGFEQSLEDRADELMGFITSWVQEKANQLVMLDTFISAIQPQKSLVFFYTKRTPLVEDTRRVLIGAGWVTHVGDWVEYNYEGEGGLRSVLWERPIHHSIRPDFKDGFILPYQAVVEYLGNHPEEDPSDYVAFVPDDQFLAFSYGSEHVSNDGAIASILSCIKAVRNTQKIIPGNWDQILAWLDLRLNELWAMRGPCPGLGSALTAFGVENGTLVAYELERMLAGEPESTGGDPWPLVDHLFRQPDTFPPEIGNKIGHILQKTWEVLPEGRRALLRLLSRFEISAPQATRYYVHEAEERSIFGIGVKDSEIISNPYLLFEEDRKLPDPVNLAVVDRGVFPDESIRSKFPLSGKSLISDALDSRRVRAFAIRQLDQATLNGHTLLSRSSLIQEIRALDVQPACPVTGDSMSVVETNFQPRVIQVPIQDGSPAYQLSEYYSAGEVIRSSVVKRVNGARHSAQIDWGNLLNQTLGDKPGQNDVEETTARKEKTAALKELYESRFTVLVGPAGTGKTMLLKVLCHEPSIQAGGVLLLAPTGKARVRMETQTGINGAKTIAQFLLPLDRYEPQAGNYHPSMTNLGVNAFKTVIIHEASMLTEGQLAAVIDAVKGVERLILVGDPRQLPPIGAGRPFLDIVNKLAPENIESSFPRVAAGYTEITIRRRQVGQIRDDLLLAEWFSGRPLDPGADEIWQKIQEGKVSQNLQFIQWDLPEELQKKLLATLVTELNLENIHDSRNFELSIGGSQFKDYVFFWETKKDSVGACSKVEDWEILSPVRGNAFGVEAINRLIQATFRSKTKEWAQKRFGRKIPKPMGREEILYGDKVIQTQNKRKFGVYPRENALQYVANGEQGIVVGQYKTRNMNFTPNKLEIEFSSQPGFKYSYTGKDFGEEANPILELAYALTVHKTQGSEYKKTFVIIPNPCRLLSRELLYTALTRQREKIIVFHQGPLSEIKNFSDDYYSESASRLTNLFIAPQPVIVKDKFLEEYLIHRTGNGLCVRSKSEVIIASELDNAKIEYTYEARFTGNDGTFRYPDFMIDDAESGKKYIWEHLGLLARPDYKRRWEDKLAWYNHQGVKTLEDGGGPLGTLITTADRPDGGIDGVEIRKIINQLFNV